MTAPTPGTFYQGVSAALEDARLTHATKTLLAMLCRYADPNGRCDPSVQTLAERLHMSEGGVRARLRILERAGYVTTIIGGGRQRNSYSLQYPPAPSLARGAAVRPPPKTERGAPSETKRAAPPETVLLTTTYQLEQAAAAVGAAVVANGLEAQAERVRIAAGRNEPPSQGRMTAWLAHYDLELDILPGIARARGRGITIKSYRYFDGPIRDVHRERTSVPEEVNNHDEYCTTTTGRARANRPNAGRGRRKRDGFFAGLGESLLSDKVA